MEHTSSMLEVIWQQNEQARAEAFAQKPPTQQKIYHPRNKDV